MEGTISQRGVIGVVQEKRMALCVHGGRRAPVLAKMESTSAREEGVKGAAAPE
jgi:hypothetical protein